MAYALLAGVPPQFGLYTAIIMTVLGSLFGSSAQLINGPTNAISLVVFGAIAGTGTGPDDPGRIGRVALLAVLVGLIQIAVALLKLGRLARDVPEPVVLGFMAGAGLLVALTQLPAVLGLSPASTESDHILYRLWLAYNRGDAIDIRAMSIGLSTTALIGSLRWLSSRLNVKLPEMLLSLVLVSAVVGLLESAPVDAPRTQLHVEASFPTPQLPKIPPDWVQQLRPIGGAALAIALLGLVEALAIARALAARSGQLLDSNRQCLAEGLANLGGGLFGCMPGSGSLSRSTINYDSGAATRMSGVFSAVVVAAALLLFAPLARFVPHPALAGALLWTAWRIVDAPHLLRCARSSRSSAAIALFTACATFAAVSRGGEFVILGAIVSFGLYRAGQRFARMNRPATIEDVWKASNHPTHRAQPDCARFQESVL
jgi:SulP family sulfate permease